jgi:hypothetical protein
MLSADPTSGACTLVVDKGTSATQTSTLSTTTTVGYVEGPRVGNEVWKLPSPQIPATDWYNRKNNDDRLNADTQPLTWEATSNPPWQPRRGHQAIVDKEGVAYILGGETADGLVNDFWKWEQSLDISNLQQSYEDTLGGIISGILGR